MVNKLKPGRELYQQGLQVTTSSTHAVLGGGVSSTMAPIQGVRVSQLEAPQ